jgi:hypothetical protein
MPRLGSLPGRGLSRGQPCPHRRHPRPAGWVPHAQTGNGYYRIGEALRDAEPKKGLREVIRADRTAPAAKRAEQVKARRAELAEPPRVVLRRHVEAAAAAVAPKPSSSPIWAHACSRDG